MECHDIVDAAVNGREDNVDGEEDTVEPAVAIVDTVGGLGDIGCSGCPFMSLFPPVVVDEDAFPAP